MAKTMVDKDKTLISVVIPMYNGGDHILNCLQNLDRQDTDLGYEVLIVDDKSTDDSVEKAEHIIKGLNRSDRFRLIKCEENGRAGRARNIGVSAASGEYVLFADQDDYPDIGLIRVLYDLSDSGQYDVVSCAVAENTKDVYYRPSLDVREGMTFEEKTALFGKYGYVFASLIRRSLLIEKNIRFPEKVMFEDVLFNDGVLASADSVRTTDKVLYYRNGDETSQTFGLNAKKMSDRVDAAMWYLSNYATDQDMSMYMDGFGAAAMFYVYLSCIRWMITDPELYNKNLLNKCIKCAKEIDPNWDIIFKNEYRIKRRYLHVLKVIYDRPAMFYVFKAMHGAKRKIRGQGK